MIVYNERVINANGGMERGVEVYQPTQAELESARFVYTTTDKFGRFFASHIDDLPNKPVVVPDEARELNNIISDPRALQKQGLTGPPRKKWNTEFDPDNTLRWYKSESGIMPLLTEHGEKVLGRSVMAGQQALFQPELFDDDRDRLALTTLADNAWDKIVKSNLSLGVDVAKEFEGTLPSQDAVQYANIGLMHAAAKFDYRKNIKFSTYAYKWARQSIQSGIPTNSRAIYIPIHTNKAARQYNQYFEDMKLQGITGPISDATIMRDLGWGQERLESVRDAERVRTVRSLDAPSTDKTGDELSGLNEYNYLASPGAEEEIYQVESMSIVDTVSKAIERLPDPVRDVMRQKIGAVTHPEDTEDEKLDDIYTVSGKKALSRLGKAMLVHPSAGVVHELIDDDELASRLKLAPCVGESHTTFFTSTASGRVGVERRNALCKECPIKEECPDIADKYSVSIGYFGNVNLDTRERNRFQRKSSSVITSDAPSKRAAS